MSVTERVEHKCSTESMCNKLNATNAYNDMTSVSALSTKKKEKKKDGKGARKTKIWHRKLLNRIYRF